MKFVTTGLICVLAFALAAIAACVVRARYVSVPDAESSYVMYEESNLARYSFLQANQADVNDGQAALLEYVNFLTRVRDERMAFPAKRLHYDLGLAYLRLFRSLQQSGKSQAANRYMELAQQELSPLGWNEEELTAAALEKSIAKREAAEEQLYGRETPPPVASQFRRQPKASAR